MNTRLILSFICAVTLLVSCRGEDKGAHDYQVWGIDVSRHQNAVNWAALCEQEKPHFVFLKATEGTLIKDPTYNNHREELKKHGILWGAYHFFGHRTSGKEQARNFINAAKLEKGNLIPVLDIEPHRFFKDPEKLVYEVGAFCKEIKSYYGVNPIIYSSTNFYNRYLVRDFPDNKYTIWIADYTGSHPSVAWDFWQHTDSHVVKGTKSKVDRNVFAGGYDQLKKHVLK